jgi:hypothetical protein
MPEHRPNGTYAEEFIWQPYRIKPLAVWAMRMNEDFKCPSLDSTLHGKAGDWLVRSDDGWMFPVVDAIFKRYYVKREWRRPDETKERNAQGNEKAAYVHAANGQGKL